MSAPRPFDTRGLMYALAARSERREAAESSSEEQQATEALPSYENATNTECRHQRVRQPGYRAKLLVLPPHLDVRQGVVPCCPRQPLHSDSWDNDETLCVRKAEELAQVLPTPGFIGVYPGIEDETSWEKFVEERRALSIEFRLLEMRAQDTLANKYFFLYPGPIAKDTRFVCDMLNIQRPRLYFHGTEDLAVKALAIQQFQKHVERAKEHYTYLERHDRAKLRVCEDKAKKCFKAAHRRRRHSEDSD